MHSEREVMSPLPTKTVSVQIKLDRRRPGTFNYPKYHQRRCHDLTSARINGVLTKSLTLRASRASRLPVWTERQTVFLHHRLALNNCTCHGYDDIPLKNSEWKICFLCLLVCAWERQRSSLWRKGIKQHFYTMTRYIFLINSILIVQSQYRQ